MQSISHETMTYNNLESINIGYTSNNIRSYCLLLFVLFIKVSYYIRNIG